MDGVTIKATVPEIAFSHVTPILPYVSALEEKTHREEIHQLKRDV